MKITAPGKLFVTLFVALSATLLSSLLSLHLFAQDYSQSYAQSHAQKFERKKFKDKQSMCDYIERQKLIAEERMKRGYKASDYDRLESRRKYWKNLYVDRCFD